MSRAMQRGSEQAGIPARILIAGGNLLAGALANALGAHGFATRQVVSQRPEIERGIEWHPNLVILDVRSLDLTSGSALIGRLHRLDLQVCVIDEADDVDRSNAWMAAGTSALVDLGEPLQQLFRTINRLLRSGSLQQTAQRSSPSLALTHAAGRPHDTRLPHFSDLTERERVVLAELMEGHCARKKSHTPHSSQSPPFVHRSRRSSKSSASAPSWLPLRSPGGPIGPSTTPLGTSPSLRSGQRTDVV